MSGNYHLPASYSSVVSSLLKRDLEKDPMINKTGEAIVKFVDKTWCDPYNFMHREPESL